jgi:hypothetical protein
VIAYGAIGANCAARDAADPSKPLADILGKQRDTHPDIGCFEYVSTVNRSAAPRQIFLLNNAYQDYRTRRIYNCKGQVLTTATRTPFRGLPRGMYFKEFKKDPGSRHPFMIW